MTPPVTLELALQHGLSEEEYQCILEICVCGRVSALDPPAGGLPTAESRQHMNSKSRTK